MMKEYEITKKHLTPNRYSRPQSKMLGVKGIAIHWVGNAKSKGMANRNYFESLKNQNKSPYRYASAHEVIGLEGEIVVCLPPNEVGFHVGAKKYKPIVKKLLNNAPNRHLYGIENCHPDWSGKFNNKTYTTLVNRVADLCIEFDFLPSKNTIFRHYDITGKDCPRFYVNNPKEWDKLINDIIKNYNEKVEEKVMSKLIAWQKEMAEKSINNLSNKGYINNPEQHKKDLDGSGIADWLYWVMLDRIEQGKVDK